MKQTAEARLETLQLRRMRAEDKFLGKLERLERAAAPLVGQLCREGRTVYYVNLVNAQGKLTGKTRESVSEYELIDFLIRNKYVS